MPLPYLPRLLTAIVCTTTTATLCAREVVYELTVAETMLAPAGKSVPALTINGGVPGPTLRFAEGDTARIILHNTLDHETTSLHWHGILLPNAMDGVPYLTTPPIQPGATFEYKFPIKQSGTYWYHSHTGSQEQRGVYGGIVISPRGGEVVHTERDEVLVLSDWTNETGDAVMRSLMRMGGTELNALKNGTMQSLTGAIQAGKLRDYLKREKARLPMMSYSDVGYDAFLMNGARESTARAEAGQTVRLRVINASASTYFYLQSATGPMRIVAADGQAVQPILVNRLLVAIAETYDVIVTLPGAGRWEIRASAQDGSGTTSEWLGNGPRHPAPDVPKPIGYGMTAALAAVLDQLDESGDQTDKEALAEEKPRPLSPYRRLAAVHATEFSASKPVHAVKLKLQGDMMRYLWTFDGKTLDEAASIKIKRGEIVRVEILNNSMMHHPVHLHGHFFRVLLGKGRYSPLKHTLDLPPMSKRIIEFDATESGDWIFHCHVLYHMMAGMSRVFSYEEPGESHQPQIAPEERNPWHFSSEASFESQMSMGMATLMNTRNNLNLVWDVGYERIMTMQDAPTAMGKDNMKMPRAGLREERTPGLEYEIDATWSRYLTPRWSAFGGWRFTNKIDSTDRAILGVSHLLPFNVDSAVSVDSEGDFRFTLAKRLQITDRLTAFGQVEYDTNMPWMWMSGLTWTLNHQFSLLTHYDSDYGLGAGLSVRF